MNLPPGWQRDGAGAKGPCPVCRSVSGRRAWARFYGGRWLAGCPGCGAQTRDVLPGLLGSGFAVAPIADRLPAALDPGLVGYLEALPAVEGAGLAYLAWRGLRPVRDVRWLPASAWPGSPWVSFLAPTRTYRGIDRGRECAADHGLPRPWCVGALVWIWRRRRGVVAAGEVEGVSDEGRQVEYRLRDGRTVKRITLPGHRFDGAVFVARVPARAARLHVCEGGPDALTVAAAAPEGEGVIGAHGAGALSRMAPWCVGRPVTIWAHGDAAGERGARALRDRLLDRGQSVRVEFGAGDVAERGYDAA